MDDGLRQRLHEVLDAALGIHQRVNDAAAEVVEHSGRFGHLLLRLLHAVAYGVHQSLHRRLHVGEVLFVVVDAAVVGIAALYEFGPLLG